MNKGAPLKARIRLGTRLDARLPAALGALLLAVFIVTLPSAGRVVAVIPAFLAFSQALIFGAMLLSAAMLLVEFRLHRQTAVALLASMYLFAAILAIGSLLFIPQFLPHLKGGAFLSVPPWLYTLRHIAIPLFAIGYAMVLRSWDGVTIPVLPRVSGWTIVLATVVAALAVNVLVVVATPYLPSLSGPAALQSFVRGPYLVGAPLYVIALVLFLRLRYSTRMTIWLAFALWAFFLDFAGHAATVDRYTVGYYVSRIYEIIGSSAALGYLIYFGFESYRSATSEASSIATRRGEERRRFAATVNSAAIGIAHIDAEGLLLFANDRLVKMFAGAQADARKSIWELFGVEAKPLPAPGEPLTFEAGINPPDDGPRTSVSTTICAPTAPATPQYWIAFVHDVTSYKAAEETVLHMNEIKSTFITTVTHEIRTPLSGIVGVSELLGRTPMTEKQRNFAQALDSSANTLLRLVNDVLDFSKIEATQVEFNRALFDLGHLVESVAESFTPEAARRGLNLSAAVSPDLAGGFYGDPVRLRQILTNLVGNALKFTERGEVCIYADGRADGDASRSTVILRVSDTGIGIPPEVRGEIFDPFTQAERATSRRFGGTGLGLAIVRRLVEQMGGQIEVTSEEGRGSTFTCTIELERDTEGRRLDQRATSLRGLRCAIVSDAAELRESLHALALSWGMHALAADSEAGIATGLKRAAALGNAPNCIVVDGDLPFASSLVTGLCSDQRYDDLQFIFLGSLPEAATHEISTWRRRLIRKPPGASALYDAILQLCVHRAADRRSEPERIELAPLRPERILIAEDNKTNRMLALAQLEELGFGADCVEDGAAAVAAVQTGLFSLILMDCQMPEMDGFDATRAIRKNEAPDGVRIPVIAMTANTSSGYREQCLEAGMDDYLAKPVLLTSLESVLDRWLALPETEPLRARTEREPVAQPPFPRLHSIFKGDRTAIFKVLDSALRTFDEMIESLSLAIEQNDAHVAGRSAHRMAGVALDVESELIAHLARAIEHSCEAEPAWPALAAHFDQLEAGVESYRLEVARYGESE